MSRPVSVYVYVPCIYGSVFICLPPPFFFSEKKASPILYSDNAESYFCKFFLGAFAWSTQKSSAAVWLTPYLDSLKTLTFNSLGISRIFMSSRGIVRAKSEIPGNSHHWKIAVPSHSAGSGRASGLDSPKGTKGLWWYSWSTKVAVGEGAKWDCQDIIQD